MRTWFNWRHVIPLPAMVAVLLILAAGATLAGANITNLGRPSNALSPYLPLGSFRHTGPTLHQHGKPELLFIGTQTDAFSAMERWPVVKALDQFGTLHGLKALNPPCPIINTTGPCLTAYPTYDWSSTRYVSRYVDFVHKDVANVRGRPFQRLTHQEAALLRRYGPEPRTGPGRQVNLDPCNPVTVRSFPVVLIGGYVETLSNIVICADYSTQVTSPGGLSQNVPLSFQQIRSRIAANARSTGPDVNAEANIITALICHADHGQPKHICGRSVIREILKHVK